MEKDWRKSKKVDELREFIDRFFKPRNKGMKNWDKIATKYLKHLNKKKLFPAQNSE